VRKTILVTGGAGYIGSHTCVELLEAGYEVVVVDNFSNSKPEALNRVMDLTGKKLILIECDILDIDNMRQILSVINPLAVIHFAGLKSVGESVAEPLLYYRNNVSGTTALLEAMSDAGIKNLVFSSSCTVYGIPILHTFTGGTTENCPLGAVNPYGRTKLTIENMLTDLNQADPEWNISILRYFNPVGAHPSGTIGEDPLGHPSNLMPLLTQLSVGLHTTLSVFGNDYRTADGTCVRDYVHVVDVAKGHIAALDKLSTYPGLIIHNLGTGEGYSVLDVIHTFEYVTGVKIPYEFVGRRAGDTPVVYADVSRAELELNWTAKFDLHKMCKDAYNWQIENPNGYDGATIPIL
jgi:UDP-glucose 4-epimerase